MHLQLTSGLARDILHEDLFQLCMVVAAQEAAGFLFELKAPWGFLHK
jgi:hypothetical protein